MKKGDASMIAAVLLVVSSIVLGVLVSTFSKESEKKVEKKIISMGRGIECEDIRIAVKETTNNGNTIINIVNRGTLGVDRIILRKYVASGDLTSDSPYELPINNKLIPNQASSYSPSNNVVKIEFIPIVIEDNEEIECDNKIVSWEAI